MDTTPDPDGTLRSLVDLAVTSDDSRELVEAAAEALHEPLGLVTSSGEPLAFAPGDQIGKRALAVAVAGARTGARTRGWRVLPLVHQSARLGVLALGATHPRDPETRSVLALLPGLLVDQLRRAGLVRLHRAAFVRRLIREPPLPPYAARREAAQLGIELASGYWPAVVAARGEAEPDLLEQVQDDARRLSHRGLTTLLDGHLVLLHPRAGGDPAPWFQEVAAIGRTLAPGSGVRAIAAERDVDIGELSATITALLRLHRFGPRAVGDFPLTSARDYALDGLLYGRVDPAACREFVDRHLGTVIAWDREHGTDLVGLLEAALDFPRHDRAAERCFMHRNTFRSRLRQATELLGEDLESPDVRLAVHVALKLRRLAGASNGGAPRVPSGT